jgi:hypothetical protein
MATYVFAPADYWKLLALDRHVDTEVLKAREAVRLAQEHRNAELHRLAVKYGFDPARPLTLGDGEGHVTQADV